MNNEQKSAARKRPNHMRALVVILTAALMATLAAWGGNAVAGGKKNHKPTVVINKGNGPALVLKNRAGNPPMQVNSTTKVGNLNADQVDGADASQLEPQTYLYSLGHFGQPLNRVATFAVPPGWYEATAHASALVNDDKSHLVGCFVYPEIEISTGNYTDLIGAQVTTNFRPEVSVAGDIFIQPNDRVVIQCTAEGQPETVTLQGSVTFTLRPIQTTSGPEAATVARHAAPLRLLATQLP